MNLIENYSSDSRHSDSLDRNYRFKQYFDKQNKESLFNFSKDHDYPGSISKNNGLADASFDNEIQYNKEQNKLTERSLKTLKLRYAEGKNTKETLFKLKESYNSKEEISSEDIRKLVKECQSIKSPKFTDAKFLKLISSIEEFVQQSDNQIIDSEIEFDSRSSHEEVSNINQMNQGNYGSSTKDATMTIKDLETSSVPNRIYSEISNGSREEFEKSIVDAAFSVAHYANDVELVQSALSDASRSEQLASEALNVASYHSANQSFRNSQQEHKSSFEKVDDTKALASLYRIASQSNGAKESILNHGNKICDNFSRPEQNRSIAIQTSELIDTEKSLDESVKNVNYNGTNISISLQKPRFCKRMFCQLGGQAIDDFFVENVYYKVTTFVAVIVPIVGVPGQFSISPKQIDLAPGMRSSFTLRFHAATLGATRVLLLITDHSPGRKSNNSEILYEVITTNEHPKNHSKRLEEKKPKYTSREKGLSSSHFLEKRFIGLDQDSTNSDDSIFTVYPSLVKLDEDACSLDYTLRPYYEPGPNAAAFKLQNNTLKEISFEIHCSKENIQIRPTSGQLQPKESIYVFVWAICRPRVKYMKDNLEFLDNGWSGSFTVYCGEQKRELSVIIDKDAFAKLPDMRDVVRHQHEYFHSSLEKSLNSSFNKKKKLLCFLRDGKIDCGKLKVGVETIVYLKLCNHSTNLMTVFINQPEKDFKIRHQTIDMKPQSYLELPVYIKPRKVGICATILQALSLSCKATQQLIGEAIE